MNCYLCLIVAASKTNRYLLCHYLLQLYKWRNKDENEKRKNAKEISVIIVLEAFKFFRHIVFIFNSKNIFFLYFRNLPEQLHGKLKSDLITGFLQKKSHILKWKHQFSVYCKDEEVLSGPIDGHFDFLEETGLIKIGKYDVLKDIFNWFNVKAIEEIDNASKEIEKALHDNNNKS